MAREVKGLLVAKSTIIDVMSVLVAACLEDINNAQPLSCRNGTFGSANFSTVLLSESATAIPDSFPYDSKGFVTFNLNELPFMT